MDDETIEVEVILRSKGRDIAERRTVRRVWYVSDGWQEVVKNEADCVVSEALERFFHGWPPDSMTHEQDKRELAQAGIHCE